ncbi:uncharacterized protein EI90DRAFT_3145216 [Cantharellus anzutake]|uniref:uncharacterized protein n=1 Tax=Cantharellus anzutake TaxID=1750568 RepID=UPI0019041010|nr:uncharacterized protein EI90DRAFT_3145216 [Cantharellus anzutake]KAF8333555.1 hypothetical protein EI90DRAFT_3145216 [Cantharellus anzutake]
MQQLGDLLGKGAFGQVYRALNWTTGETVAVKQIQLSSIPKAELGEIMSEIDLLKNLNHPNIVKYKGFVKTREYLYIILEYCENGSLHNICKKFGKFPENLVAVYISQVLEGLVYLHEQGVIHRDIKGANLLTNKDGRVKLADFGVATTHNGAINDAAVVGSPYWMAPEVIEQSGATTASDIWSVGCVVIELLEGKPPYHFLDPMPALFRIVQDDSPPIPEGASAIVKDFLYHCFQKDCNLRISAKKLLKHHWMVSVRKQLKTDGISGENSLSNFDEALQKVQEWNEALKSPSRPLRQKDQVSPFEQRDRRIVSPTLPTSKNGTSSNNPLLNFSHGLSLPLSNQLLPVDKNPNGVLIQQPEEDNDNWDDDFEGNILLEKLRADKSVDADKCEMEDNAQTIRPTKSPSIKGLDVSEQLQDLPPIVEDYSDIAGDEDNDLQAKVKEFKMRTTARKTLYHPDDIKGLGYTQPRSRSGPSSSSNFSSSPPRSPSRHTRSLSLGSGSVGKSEARWLHTQSKLGRYIEGDEEDYEDVFATSNDALPSSSASTLQLTTRLSRKSWFGDDDLGDDDPFAEIDEEFAENDLETNLIRDRFARLCALISQLVDQLVPTAADYTLREICHQLLVVLTENPDMQVQFVLSHGLLAVVEILESRPSRDVLISLLKLTNMLVTNDLGILESFCLIGGIPVVMAFTSKKYSLECRSEASNFVQLLCQSSMLTLQMFISCRGLKVLVELLDEDYSEQKDLVVHALSGVASVFELQSPTSKNDFCRMFIREGLLDPLTSALLSIIASQHASSPEPKAKALQILLIFCQVSQSDSHVRQALGTRKLIRRLLRACELLDPEYIVTMLKAIKHLSMNSTLLDVLQNSNAIEILVQILAKAMDSQTTETSNHIFQTCFNLCRLNKLRQEEAAQAGIIPHLLRIIDVNSPLKQFALPILCDLASAGKSCRSLLWQHNGLSVYLNLLSDPYFQVSALEAILSWLQDETSRVEDIVGEATAVDQVVNCFINAKANSFENLLDPFIKIFRISSSITLAISASPKFLKKLVERLNHNKAIVRLNLLRILRAICDTSQDKQALVQRYGFHNAVQKLSQNDGAVLVRELAREIAPALMPNSSTAGGVEPEQSNTDARGGRRRTPGRRAASDASGLAYKVETVLLPKPGRGRLKPVPRTKLNDLWRASEDRN